MCLSSSNRLAQDGLYDGSCKVLKVSKMVKSQCLSTFQVSAYVIFANDLLAKTSW